MSEPKTGPSGLELDADLGEAAGVEFEASDDVIVSEWDDDGDLSALVRSDRITGWKPVGWPTTTG